MKTRILICAMLFSITISAQEITGSPDVDKLYATIINANGKSLQQWGEEQAEKGIPIQLAPSGKKYTQLKPVEQKILQFVVKVEEIRLLKKQINSLKIGSSTQKQKQKELAEKLKNAEIVSSSTQKEIDDTGSAILGNVN